MANLEAKKLRQRRVRAKVAGSPTRPRLQVAITNRHVVAQLIDDQSGRTLAYSTSMGQKLPVSMSERAKWAGQDVAKKAAKAKIKQVVFDRSGRQYGGRVKLLAEAARHGGLEF